MFKFILPVFLILLQQTQCEPPQMPKFQLVYLKWDWTIAHRTEGTAKIANEWSQLLKSAQIDVMMLPLGPGRVMLMGEKLKKVRKFVLEQPEVD